MLLLLACSAGPDPSPPLNLSAALGPDEVRAGIVLETDALFDGIAAEGRLGDIKIYNDRARFIIQQPGDSSYYVEYGGMLIDADIVRAEGAPGRDAIDELGPMIGLGRIVNAEKVTVMDDGQAGEAWVRVVGPAQSLQIMTGSLENPDLVPNLDLWVCTDYRLKAGSPLLDVTTTVKNREATDQDLFIGDIGFLSMEAVERYRPRTGLDNDGEPVPWEGAMGRADEVALALLSQEGDLDQGMAGSLLSALGPVISGFGPTTTVAAGESLSFHRYIGVAPDLATLSAEQQRLQGQSLKTLSGHVQSEAGPVAGTRIHLLDAQNQPLTLTFTDEAGDWSAEVPQDVSAWRVSGVGDAVWVDLPAGHGWYGAYAADHTRSLTSFTVGGPVHPFARGFGLSEATSTSPSSLSAPGQVSVQVQDGLPAVLRIDPLDTVIPLDRRFVSHDDRTVWGLIRDGNLDVSLPAGMYRLVVYRGVQDELYAENITVTSSAQTNVSASILPAYRAESWVSGDPHTHASPSGDGEISMEDRLIAMAANGIDVHFGTDHDHVADYRPLLTPLGLDRVLTSIVADEVSPVLRGHFNAWPLESLPKANGGAWRWWQGYEDTTDVFNHIRAMLNDGIISSNHPIGKSGMMSFAKFSPQSGEVAAPDHWSSDFDAMEVINSGDYLDYFEAYLSLINRGLIVTPFGVSDSHGYSSGGLGLNLTFFHTDDQLSPEALVDAVRRQATVASHGPFIDARINDTSAPGILLTAETSLLEVTVYAPSWMPVDIVSLYENGVVTSALPCEGIAPTPCTAQWTLAPAQDAAYVVTASSSLPMIDAHPGELAWAMTAAIRVDVGGDGWSSPLPALFP